MTAAAGGDDHDRADLRLVAPALGAWAGAMAGPVVATGVAIGVGVVALAALAWVLSLVRGPPGARDRRVSGARRAAVAALVCAAGGLGAAGLRVAALHAGPVDDLAGQSASVTAQLLVTSDPVLRRSTTGGTPGWPYVLLHARVETLTARGVTADVRTPVLVIADETWLGLLPSQQVAMSGRLAAAERGGPVAAVLRARGEPEVLTGPGLLQRAVEPLRAGLRASVSGLDPPERGLVPALVVGDETAMTDELRADLQATGLTHLTAVSGANVAIVLAAVVGLARWVGVRGYGLPVTGVLSVAGFVVLARPEPSVLRAAAMGIVAVVALTAGGRRRGIAALCTAVLLLVLADPWLARSYGFVLSVLATAGILVVAPAWRDALARWLPRPLAMAVAVPLAAQLACTPVVVVLSGGVSLAAVPANLLAAAAIAPATVLGVLAAVLAPLSGLLGRVAGTLAGLPAAWIVEVAERGARLPGAQIPWSPTPLALVILTLACVAVVVVLPSVLRRRGVALAVAVALLVALLRPADGLGWPPPGWVLVACDVGQGDAVVLSTGPDSAVVVDAGPDPDAVDRCLDSLGVRDIPAVVLTHFHADHIAGLPGVLRGRRVAEVIVSPLDEPPEQAEQVREWVGAAGVPVVPAVAGTQQSTGALSWRVLWPQRIISGEGSAANNASLVLLAEAYGVRLLLAGDVEPLAQRAILRLGADPGVDLGVDVLKVPHHGSAYQDPAFLEATDPRLAVVSVGEGNTYGHPSPATLDLLAAGGATVVRTDLDGTTAVVRADDGGDPLGTGDPLDAGDPPALGIVRRGRRSGRVTTACQAGPRWTPPARPRSPPRWPP